MREEDIKREIKKIEKEMREIEGAIEEINSRDISVARKRGLISRLKENLTVKKIVLSARMEELNEINR